MSTIVWDGETLSGDRCSWSGGVRRKVKKVFKVTAKNGQKFLVGFVGEGCLAMQTLKWMQGDSEKPKASDFDYDVGNVLALVIDEKKRIWQLGASLVYTRCLDKKYCIGAGQELAWGALEAGATSKRAVEIVAKRSDFAGLGVDSISF